MSQPPLELPAPLARRLERRGDEFLVEFLSVDVRRNPRNLDALAELGQAYSRLGRLEEGLAVDRQLVRLVPDNPTAHYNLACSLALVGCPDEALDALERAVELGYDDAAFLLEDDDLASLRDEERFRRLVRRLEVGAS